jgi:hypothetical protein
MNFIEPNNKLSFISNYWKELKIITNSIENELPIVGQKNVQKVGKKLNIVQYKDISNWDVKNMFGESASLKALANKITNMIFKGDAPNVEPMLRRICYKGVHKLSTPASHKGDNGEFLGYGHFRWNCGKFYVLTPEEIERVKEYFKI